ncbi:MAG: STY0301 family protein [Azonexus sp.]
MRINLILSFLCAAWTLPVLAAEVCPARPGQQLQFIDVFDGPPEEMAFLRPGRERPRSGAWELGYIYDAGRSVTIRCKYADEQALDVKLSKRVGRCNYRLDAKKTLKLDCV